jgi:hypothetical protein
MTATAFAGRYGPAQLLDGSNRPLANRQFQLFARSTTTPAPSYADRLKHPLTGADRASAHMTDARGYVAIWADPGLYDVACGGITFPITVLYDAGEGAGYADLNVRAAAIPSPASDTSGTKAAIDAIRTLLQT